MPGKQADDLIIKVVCTTHSRTKALANKTVDTKILSHDTVAMYYFHMSHMNDTSMCNGINTVVANGVYSRKSRFGTSANESMAKARTIGLFIFCQNVH